MNNNAESEDFLLTALMNQHVQAVFIFNDNLLSAANFAALRLIKTPDETDIIGLPFEAFFAEKLDKIFLHHKLSFQSPLTLISTKEMARYPATIVRHEQTNKLLVILSSDILPSPAQNLIAADLDSASNSIGHWQYTLANAHLWWDAQTFEIYGQSKDNFTPALSSFLQQVHPNDKTTVKNSFDQAVADQTDVDICHRILTVDNKLRHLRHRATWDPDKKVLFGTILDLTDLRQHLSDSDNLLRLMDETQRIGHMGSWEMDFLNGKVIWSQQTALLFGVKLNEFAGTIEGFQQFVLPEDKVKLDFSTEKMTNAGLSEVEYRITRKNDGSIRWLFDCSKSIFNTQQHEIRRLGVTIDITERKRLEMIQQLESTMVEAVASAVELDQILEKIVLGVEKIIPNTIASILLIDEEGKRLLSGAAPNLPVQYNDAIHGELIGPKVGSCGTAAYLKKPIIVADIANDSLWEDYAEIALLYNLRACWSHPIFNEKQKVIATFAIYHNKVKTPEPEQLDTIERILKIISIAITKHRNESKLRISENRFKNAFQDAATGVAIINIEGQFLECNKAYCDMLEYTEEEVAQLNFLELTHPEDQDRNQRQINDILLGIYDSRIIEKRYLSKTGKTVWARLSVSLQRDDRGQPLHLITIAENITGNKLAELKRDVAERSLTQLLKNLPGIAYRCLCDEHWTMLYVSEAFSLLTGYSADDVIGNQRLGFASIIHPDDREETYLKVLKAIKRNQSFQIEYRIIRKDGNVRWFWEQGNGVRDRNDKLQTIEGYMTDITSQKQADQNIRESEQRFQLLSKTSNDVIRDWDLVTNKLWWSESFQEMFGFDSQKSYPSLTEWENRIHPDDRDKVLNGLAQSIETTKQSWSHHYKFRRHDGRYADVIDRSYIIYDDDNTAVRMVSGISDISERLEMEDKLRQSQRLEAVGQLTGGVAHDFNNLLTVIMGNAEIITESLATDSKLRGLAEMIQEAAQRGSELTRDLLAFARRQPLDPKHVNTNQLLQNFQPLLARSLGASIDLQFSLQSEPWLAQIDPGQLENALLNLALNAKDAMPSGGRLLIETRNVSLSEDYGSQYDIAPGDYVFIGVSDTGVGIAPENIDKVFEPFYTTKSKDKGTGLGLAMVYGFARQSFGHINLYSEVGQGTTIRLYLPRSIDPTTSIENMAKLSIEPSTGYENILVVEDDDLVRSYVISQLELLGYHVISASNGHDAMDIIQSDEHIDLLFTDVIMPGNMSGRDLSDKALRLRPQLKVLFTSGYSENSIVHHGRLDPGVMLLSKPYSRDELSLKLRQALDSKI